MPQPIMPSGNIATAIKDIFGASNSAINDVSEIAGALADATSAIGVIGGVISVVQGLLNQGVPDEVQVKLDAIQNAIKDNFHALTADLAANQILDRNTQLHKAIDQADARFRALAAEISAGPAPPQVVEYIVPCIQALDDLGGGPPEGPIDFAWNMDFDWQIYWTDAGQYFNYDIQGNRYDVGYGLQAPQPNADGATVFVYAYSLPLYLYAVDIFLAVAGSLDPNFIANYTNVLRQAAALLRSKHDKILQDGLTPLFPYDWTQDTPPELNPAQPGYRADGGILVIEYGAVEKFSGYSSIGANFRLDRGALVIADYYFALRKLQLRVLKRMKDVYVAVGLSRVWEVINKLNALVGDPPMPRPSFVDWSLRECVRAVDLDPPGTEYYHYLRNLARFIITARSHDTPYPVNPPWPSISIRALLTNFNDT